MNKGFRLNNFDEFRDPAVISSLKRISCDSESKHPGFLSECKTEVIDFDELKKMYMIDRGMEEGKAKSVDALYRLKSDKLCMVEFKNGMFSSPEIIEKAMSSILIFNDITGTNVKFTRENMYFVLVYNSDVKKPSHRQIAAYRKGRLSNNRYSLFGLDHLDGFCFFGVEEIDKKDFDDSIFVKDIQGR